MDNSGRSKGCALARFKVMEDAERAIAELDGFNFEGRNLVMKFDEKKSVASA